MFFSEFDLFQDAFVKHFQNKKGHLNIFEIKGTIIYSISEGNLNRHAKPIQTFLDEYVLLLTFMLRHFISCLFAGIMTTISNCHNDYNKTNILHDTRLLHLLLYGNRCIQIICVFYFPNLLLSILSCNNSLRFTFHWLGVENL